MQMRSMSDLEHWDPESAEIIGHGMFGTVYSGYLKERQGLRHYRPRTPVAIKVLKEIPLTAAEQKKVCMEARIGMRLKFPSLMPVLYFSMSSDRWCIVSPRARSSLRRMIRLSKNGLGGEVWQKEDGQSVEWNATKRAICAFGVAAALCFMHEKGVIHRDIKPDNILLDENMYPQVSDFGLSRKMPEDQNDVTRMVGTPLYMAPETLEGASYNEAVDVYAYGVMLDELYTLNTPLRNARYLSELKGHAHEVDAFKNACLGEELQNLIEKCCDKDPRSRPTMRQVVNMFNDLDFSLVDPEVDLGEFDYYRFEITSALKRANSVK